MPIFIYIPVAITSISSVINKSFLTSLGNSASAESSSSSSGGDSKSAVINGLSSGARAFSNAMAGLNSLASFINVTRRDLQDFKNLTTEMIEVVTKATKPGIGQNKRTALNGEFEDLVTQFKKKVSTLSKRDYDGTTQEGLEEIFSLLGFDKKSSKGFAALLTQFDFVENEEGQNVLASDTSQAKRPIAVPQSALQTQVRTITSNGDGTFYQTGSGNASAGNTNYIDARNGDFNGDSIQDVALLSDSGSLSVMFGNGDGTFKTAVTMNGVESLQRFDNISIGDLNNDGRDDILTTSGARRSPYYYSLLGNTDGTFAHPTTTQSLPALTTTTPHTSALADIDGDGILDLISTNTNTASVFTGYGDGTFTSPTTFLPGSSGFTNITAVDIDNDTEIDLIFSGTNGVRIMRNNGGGSTFGLAQSLTGNVSGGITVADFDGNGYQDIVASDTTNGQLRVWLNNSGTYGSVTTLNAVSGVTSVYSSDINNDGIQDIVALSPTERKILTYFGNGNGSFQSAITTIMSSQPNAAAIFDADGDGLKEIVTGNAANGGSDSYSTLTSTPAVSESIAMRSGTKDYSGLFSTGRTIKDRIDAFKMLADLKALDGQLDNNIEAIGKAFDFVYENMQMIRKIGLSFIDAANEVATRAVTDPDAITSILQQKVRGSASSTMRVLENLKSIIAVSENRLAGQKNND